MSSPSFSNILGLRLLMVDMRNVVEKSATCADLHRSSPQEAATAAAVRDRNRMIQCLVKLVGIHQH